MKNLFICLFLISCPFLCCSQSKSVDIFFPDSVHEKEVTIHYSIYGIVNYFYEKFEETKKTRENHISFVIPDSISTFLIMMYPPLYQSTGHTTFLMKQGEKLTIYLDSIQPAKFGGDNLDLHCFMYELKKGTGVERAVRILSDFMTDSSAVSFYNFINQKIALNIASLDSMLINNQIDTVSYGFARNQTIDEYLFRSALIGLNTSDKKYLSKIDSVSFYSDLDSLFTKYNDVYDWGLSATGKAELRSMGFIPCVRLDLGLDSICSLSSYLNRNEQERVVASELINGIALGQLDSLQLARKRNKYEAVFPRSIFNSVLNQIKPLTQKEYILASYSIKDGFNEYGRFKMNDLKSIIGMFMAGKLAFVDFWATWCGPCIQEFGYMKDDDAFLKEHNIGILYVSLDFPGAYDKWKQRIVDLQLEGLHYFGGQNFSSQLPYFQEYKYIPRYVLLDKDGATLINKCELPSSGKLIQQLKDKLGL